MSATLASPRPAMAPDCWTVTALALLAGACTAVAFIVIRGAGIR